MIRACWVLIPFFVIQAHAQMSTQKIGQKMSQTSTMDSSIEKEMNQAEGPVQDEPLPEIKNEIETEQALPKEEKKREAILEQEQREQDEAIRQHKEQEIEADEKLNRFPKQEPLFEKPPGPVQGGELEVSHPNAAKGLIRINKDGSYQYGLRVKDGKKAASFRISVLTPPNIASADGRITFKSMYGSANLVGAAFDFEWRPYRRFGIFGIQFGTGFWTAQGNGYFKDTSRTDEPQDRYNLFVIPLNIFAVYRMDYSHKQWLVPYLKGGGTLYGLAEVRDDYNNTNFAHAEAVGGGGGLAFSLGRLSPANGYTLAREYGIADLWINLEARAMQGIEKKLDFTNQIVELGLTVDY